MPALAVENYHSDTLEPNLDNETVTTNYDQLLEAVLKARYESEFWRYYQLITQAERQLRELGSLGRNWDSYGAEAPNATARETAERIITLLKSSSMVPTRIVASSEGGVEICFVREDRYADFECFNSGEVVAVRYRGREEPHVWPVTCEDNAINTAIEQIRAHISA